MFTLKKLFGGAEKPVAESAEMTKGGTLAQQLKLKELRAGIAQLKDICKTLDDAEAANTVAMNELWLSLSCEVAAKIKLALISNGDKTSHRLELGRRNPGKIDPLKYSKDMMDILEEKDFLKGKERLKELAFAINLFANDLNKKLGSGERMHKKVGAEDDMFWAALSTLAVLKFHGMDESEQQKYGTVLVDLFSQRQENAADYAFANLIVNRMPPTGALSDELLEKMADKLEKKYYLIRDSVFNEGFPKAQSARRMLSQDAFSSILSAEEEALEKAAKLGLVDANMNPDHERIQRELMEKEYALVGLVREIVSSSEKAKTTSFEGLPENELAELSAFWKAYPEHPDAQSNLDKIRRARGCGEPQR